jgi:L1 cell adhesion molecule like protein
MPFGLLYAELVDAVREGDGLRVLRWWRFVLLNFKATSRRNYSIEAFILLAQYQYLLCPREKSQLLYSRFINTHGLPGRNISCDLYMEHLNRLLKEAIKAPEANKTPKVIDCVGKCIAPLDELLERFHTIHNYSPHSDHHKNPSAVKDITIMLEQLRKADVFHSTHGCKHHALSPFSNNP